MMSGWKEWELDVRIDVLSGERFPVAMYSASGDDSATKVCFFDHQLIGPLIHHEYEAEADFLSLLSPAQSVRISS